MSERVYIFDVDNTLTPPTRGMSRQFLMRFINWAKNKNIYIVCGGTYDKVKNQLPRSVMKTFSGMFFCMGNELRVKNEIKYQKEFESHIDDLKKKVAKDEAKSNSTLYKVWKSIISVPLTAIRYVLGFFIKVCFFIEDLLT